MCETIIVMEVNYPFYVLNQGSWTLIQTKRCLLVIPFQMADQLQSDEFHKSEILYSSSRKHIDICARKQIHTQVGEHVLCTFK